MTYIDIKPGQWVLAFNEPYGPHDKPMAEHLEMFVHEGGGWDGHRASEILTSTTSRRSVRKPMR